MDYVCDFTFVWDIKIIQILLEVSVMPQAPCCGFTMNELAGRLKGNNKENTYLCSDTLLISVHNKQVNT